MRRALALALLPLALASCRKEPRPAAGPPLLPVPPLAAGLRFTIAPNLPDVPPDDVPETTQRVAEVLAVDGGRLRLRWTGRVKRETPESAERRASWLRARTNAGSAEKPPPPAPPLFMEAEVSGTLELPDFAKSRALLLPGLWPEGRALMKDCSGLWLGRGALEEIAGTRRASVPFVLGKALRDPAAALLERAAELAKERDPAGIEEWRLEPGPGRSPLTVNGVPGEVATLSLSSWFGRFEVLADAANPLVLSADPVPASTGAAALLAPTRVLKALLSYRVVALDARPAEGTR